MGPADSFPHAICQKQRGPFCLLKGAREPFVIGAGNPGPLTRVGKEVHTQQGSLSRVRTWSRPGCEDLV